MDLAAVAEAAVAELRRRRVEGNAEQPPVSVSSGRRGGARAWLVDGGDFGERSPGVILAIDLSTDGTCLFWKVLFSAIFHFRKL